MTGVGRARRELVRLQAAQWFAEGRANAEVAAELRVGLRQVEKWRQAWRQGGVHALRSKGRTSGCVWTRRSSPSWKPS
ncbi:helix-turn-helix domain-containing protein [Actinomadura opuntiae]|uniref:helix-turn-helix domain-containing protein n=1 Tax=Actinomadura sp. OS1-43 TaxID=604315 RepID=UPI00333EE291